MSPCCYRYTRSSVRPLQLWGDAFQSAFLTTAAASGLSAPGGIANIRPCCQQANDIEAATVFVRIDFTPRLGVTHTRVDHRDAQGSDAETEQHCHFRTAMDGSVGGEFSDNEKAGIHRVRGNAPVPQHISCPGTGYRHRGYGGGQCEQSSIALAVGGHLRGGPGWCDGRFDEAHEEPLKVGGSYGGPAPGQRQDVRTDIIKAMTKLRGIQDPNATQCG